MGLFVPVRRYRPDGRGLNVIRLRSRGIVTYLTVTAAYWAFMLTDGALRMLVLLHFHGLGFSPVQLAYLFVLYEIAGVITNLSAGWIAARFGLTSTLYAGLIIQIIALGALAQLDPGWSLWASVGFVMAVQGASGVAKDLAKMSSKSAVKLLAPDQGSGLFRWVALLTGSKNAVKGFGFFCGAALLATLGFVPAIVTMAGVLSVILVATALFMPGGLPGGQKGTRFRQVFSKNPLVNALSLARFFLFGARDVWFVVGIPIYFYAVWSDGTPDSNRAAFFWIGCFMAGWIIFYGVVQAAAPKILAQQSASPMTVRARNWAGGLCIIPVVLAACVALMPAGPVLTACVVIGLLIFGAVFAVNSAVHSYLILAFAGAERVTFDVGFYYMANAGGRLMGTVLSGASYQVGGLVGCLSMAAAMAAASWAAAGHLARRETAGNEA